MAFYKFLLATLQMGMWSEPTCQLSSQIVTALRSAAMAGKWITTIDITKRYTYQVWKITTESYFAISIAGESRRKASDVFASRCVYNYESLAYARYSEGYSLITSTIAPIINMASTILFAHTGAINSWVTNPYLGNRSQITVALAPPRKSYPNRFGWEVFIIIWSNLGQDFYLATRTIWIKYILNSNRQ